MLTDCTTGPDVCGGNNRARTCDPMLVRHVLSQLSYAPFVSLLRCSPQRRGSLYTFVPVLSTPFFRKNPSFFRRTFCVPKLSVRLTCFPENVILDAYGELSEWFKEPVLKTGDGETHREFESHTLRQRITVILIQRNDGYFIPKISIFLTYEREKQRFIQLGVLQIVER